MGKHHERGRWRRRLANVAVAAVVAFAGAGNGGTVGAEGPERGAPWPQFKGDGARSGRATVNGPSQPVKAWAFDAGSPIVGGPVVAADGTIYVITQDQRVRAVASNGSERWSNRYGADLPGFPTHPLLTSRGQIVFGLDSGFIVGLNPRDGKLAFSVNIRTAPYGENAPGVTPIQGHPGAAPNYGRYLIGADHGVLFELDGASVDGVRRAGGSIRSGAAVTPDGTVVWAGHDKLVYGGHAAGGDKWRRDVDGKVSATPAVGPDSTVYVATEVGSVYAFSSGGQLKWRTSPGFAYPFISSPAVGPDGSVYLGALDGKVYALDPNSGAVKWSYGTLGPVVSTPAVGANGLVYVGSTDSLLYVLTKDGKLQSAFKAEGSFDLSAPAIGADGTLYVGARDGRLYALRDGAPSAVPAPAASPTVAPVATVAPPSATPPPARAEPAPLLTAPVAPLAGARYVPETGHNLVGPFLDYFDRWGGVEQFGYPLTEIVFEDGRPAQWFQRARMELHPDGAGTAEAIQLSMLGYIVAGSRLPFPSAGPGAAGEGDRFFPESGYTVRGPVLRYFEAAGGTERFGLPLSEEVEDVAFDASGRMLTAQYFQRGRLERHAELAGGPDEIQQTPVGEAILRFIGALP